MEENQKIEIIYFQIVDLWQRLCEEHQKLFQHTCKEYQILLEGRFEDLELILEEKNNIIKYIGELNQLRQDVITKINEENTITPIQNVADLLKMLEIFEMQRPVPTLKNLNQLLIEIIEKLQHQNKKNQLFLNKAVHSLKQIREEVVGKKYYCGYNAKGTLTKATLANG